MHLYLTSKPSFSCVSNISHNYWANTSQSLSTLLPRRAAVQDDYFRSSHRRPLSDRGACSLHFLLSRYKPLPCGNLTRAARKYPTPPKSRNGERLRYSEAGWPVFQPSPLCGASKHGHYPGNHSELVVGPRCHAS